LTTKKYIEQTLPPYEEGYACSQKLQILFLVSL